MFASGSPQVVDFSRPDATSSTVALVPTVVSSVLIGQPLVAKSCCHSQPSSTFYSSWRSQIGSFLRWCVGNGVWSTTDDREIKRLFYPVVDFEGSAVCELG